MSYRKNIAVLLAGCLFLLGGCGRDEAANGIKKDVENNVAAGVNPCLGKDSDVLVVVNGQPVTSGDFKRRLDLERAIVRYRIRQVVKNPDRKDAAAGVDKYVDDYSKDRMPRIIPELVNNVLVAQAMVKYGVVVSNEAEKAAIKRSSLSFGVKKGGESEVAKKLGYKDASFLREQFLLPGRYNALREKMQPESMVVTEKEIDEGLERQNKYYERAIASNTVTYATCSNVLAQIKSGKVDFADAGQKYAQVNPESVVEGEEFDNDDFATENDAYKKPLADLKKWAYKAEIGDVSGPWEMEDGLSIVKLLARTGRGASAEEESDEPDEVKLARITFVMLEPEPEPRTREFVKESLLKWKAGKAQEAMFKKLHAEMKLEYPLGTNFSFSVSSVKERK